jgi:hypothetical protein
MSVIEFPSIKCSGHVPKKNTFVPHSRDALVTMILLGRQYFLIDP